MKDLLKDNAWNIIVAVVMIIGTYFTVQTNTKEIELLKLSIVELESNKVSVSTMELKEQFLASKLTTIEGEILHIDGRLTKKIKMQNEMNDDLKAMITETAVHEQRLKQNESELDGLWKFTNKFLESLN